MARPITVLFVDDDPLVRDALPDALPEREFRSITADDGCEALRVLAREQVDVLVSDVVMPKLDGIELAMRAKRMHPNLAVVLMTGYYLSRAAEAEAAGRLLCKPVRPDEIEAAIRKALRLSSGPRPGQRH